ncbi:MAG: single-stranded-DNA-specific exonuclease RecJ [Patescibacteria group bacterium]|jgi:single-stranded-DNA-specific exonuclease
MDKKWIIKEKQEYTKNNPGLHPVIFRLLANRGFSVDEIEKFLKLDYKENLHDPFLFKNMKAAVELIFKHMKNGSRIIIYGDYDADGVTATAVMQKTLEFLGCKNLDIYIPHRESEGYGINKSAVEEIAKSGASLIITVDTGIRSIGEVALAKEKGMDVVLTDHHECGEQVPDCLIINPKVNGEKYPFRDLAGVGVAFKVSQALLYARENHAQHNAKQREKEGFEKWLLDLVAIGTIADLMPLVNENRVLVNYGLVVLNKTQRIGIKKLMETAQSDTDKNGNKREVDAWQIGYQLAPRLNAAGRLGRANTAYELLITEDKQEATEIAHKLDNTNKERQNITQEIFEQAEQEINKKNKILFAVYNGEQKNAWSSGVMGLVAGKLTEKYYRPSLAITSKIGNDGLEIVGSARSIAEFNITSMLEECGELLSHYGGHKQAAGFTIKPGKLDEFLAKAKKITEHELKDVELIPALEIDLEINFNDVSEDLYEALQKLRPFGVKNAQPKFVSKNLKVINAVKMGNEQQHLKLQVTSYKSQKLSAVGFSVLEEWKKIKIGDEIDLVYYIDMNEWNGRREVQLKIIDLKNNSNIQMNSNTSNTNNSN